MPIIDHDLCKTPDMGDTIWRYMDFTQFTSILENEQLFFCRADLLGDPYEGSLPRQHSRVREVKAEEYPDEWVFELLPRFREICTKNTYLNCWHINNEGESAAMWDLYLKSNEGICIQTTVENLFESIRGNDAEDVYISEVKYIDYDEEKLTGWEKGAPLGDTMSPFIHKRNSFRYEKELRAIIHDLPWEMSENESWITAEEIEQSPLQDESLLESGRYLNVDLENLIQNVYIAPYAGDWIENLVGDVCSTYGLDSISVQQSSMKKDPLY